MRSHQHGGLLQPANRRLRAVGDEPGLDGGDKLTQTTFIQRVHTVGGVAPSTDCAPLGAKLFVPYETDYVFYRAD